MDAAPLVALEELIDALSLAINLRLVQRAHVQFNDDSLEQLAQELACEDWVTTRDDRF